MKIVRRGSKTSSKFRVVKDNFYLAGGYRPSVGETLEFVGADNLSVAFGLVQRGLIIPDDLPDKGEYICVRDFSLPGRDKKYEAKVNDTLELKAKDALELMLKRLVIPRDENQWSPFRLKKKKITPFQQHLKDIAKSWSKE